MVDSTTGSRRYLMRLLTGILGLALAAGTAPAEAGKGRSKKGKEAKAAQPARHKTPPPARSGLESRAERDKRLLRECQGRPNAGACEGYANARR